MAHFKSPREGVVRAEIYKRGVRASRTFSTEAEAREWATATERRIERQHEPARLADDPSLLAHFPRRLLEAIQSAPFDLSEVLSNAVPSAIGAGVYFLIKDGEVKYVGKSTNVLARLYKHMHTGRVFDSYNVVTCPAEQMADLERTYITAFMPPWNQSLGGPAESVQIRPRRAKRSAAPAVSE